jgi:hypothetical protein
MRRTPSSVVTGHLMEWLVAGISVSLAILIWFGYGAIREWQRSEESLADRRARDTADLLATALSRDMRGVQNAVLPECWEELTVEPTHDVRKSVASAFARYPYPESFFVWRRAAADSLATFFNRSDRPPAWLTPAQTPTPFPVVIGRDDAIARAILDRVHADGHLGRRFSVFEIQLGDVSYQIVARVFFASASRSMALSGSP